MSKLVVHTYDKEEDYKGIMEKFNKAGCNLLAITTNTNFADKQYIWKKHGYSKMELDTDTCVNLVFECPSSHVND